MLSNSRSSTDSSSENLWQVCFSLNKWRCSFGFSCKFQHICSYCSSTSHGLTFCFKAPKGSQGVSASQGGSKRVRSPVSVDLKPNKVFDQFVHHILLLLSAC